MRAFAAAAPQAVRTDRSLPVDEMVAAQVVDRMLLNHLGTTEVQRELRVALRAYTGL